MTRFVRRPVVARVVLTAAAVAAALSAPAWVATPLVTVAAVAVLLPLVRLRSRGVVDELLVGAAGVLIALALLGVVLDIVPGGITRVSWAVGYGVLLLAGIVWTELWSRTWFDVTPDTFTAGVVRSQRAATRRRVLREAPWFVGAVGLLTVAIVVATRAARTSEQRPLALSVVETRAGGTVELAVSTGPQQGRFTLTVHTGSTSTTVGPFELDRFVTVHRTVRVPAAGPATVTLQLAGATNPLRTLTFDAQEN